jgi:hypothetical protein
LAVCPGTIEWREKGATVAVKILDLLRTISSKPIDTIDFRREDGRFQCSHVA